MLWIWYTASWAICLWFQLSSPGASTYAKMPEILAAKGRTICRKVWSVILQKWPLPSHLNECLLPQIYDKWLTVTFRLSVRNMFSKQDLRQHMIINIEVRTSDYVCSLCFRNVNYANRRNSSIDDRTTVYLCRKWSIIMTWPNFVRSFLTRDLSLNIYALDMQPRCTE